MRMLACLMLLLATALPVQALAQTRIGFVNAERVTRESGPAVRAFKRLEREFEKRQLELRKLEQNLQSLQAQLERSGLTMAEADRRAKEREFLDLSRDFQRRDRAFREDYAQRQNEELTGIQEQANRVIQQIAERERFDLILQEAVYVNPAIDITEKVLKALAEVK
jgi:outer membrane protein